MSAHYALFGKFTTAPEDRDKLVDILSSAAALMAKADGCYSYIVYVEPADNSAVWVSELWENEAAHDASLSVEGVRELITQAMPLIKGQATQFKLVPAGGHGL